MAQIGNVPEIKAVKTHFEELREKGLVEKWEVPYENILTRLSAAVFFMSPARGVEARDIFKELEVHKMLKYRLNEERRLSKLTWRVEFNEGLELK